MNRTLDSTQTAAALFGPCNIRTSEVLAGILTKNPGVEVFSIERILAAIGHDRFEASLMMFAIPAVVPVPRPRGMVALPTGAVACQLAAGRKQIRLPRAILQKSVSRRALAVAIHATLPILQAAERVVRPRWSWVTHPLARRAIGLFVFLLAVAIACPLSGFQELHAISIFVVSLGVAEQDGLAVTIGLIAGMLSLAMLAASGLSMRALRAKVAGVLRGIGKKLGVRAIAGFLRRLGYRRLANFITLEWTALVVTWDPEGTERVRRAAARARVEAAAATRHPAEGPVERAQAFAVRPPRASAA